MRTLLSFIPPAAVSQTSSLGPLKKITKVPTKIQNKLQEWETHILALDAKDPAVSQVPVAWHLDHGLKVINGICSALQKSDPSRYKKNFSFARTAVYLLGSIPRGVGKSPRSVLPPENIVSEDIEKQLAQARANIDKFPQMPAKAHFKHPVFGVLNRDQSMRFLEIHTEHHLKIIRDILS